MTSSSSLVSHSHSGAAGSSFSFTIGDGVFDKMNNQETIDIAWDAARRQYKQNTQNPANQSIHAICGQSIELVLKASVASRTLDNITGVLISFKNFRKTLKNEAASERPPA
jgi:superoxide dismutase